ncbi:MAG: DUF4432 family protein [Bacteroidales bacterium]|jgi:hypothetical protein|nr:DUF4432 family protein [Bacteroidales bacterium]
MNGTFHLEKTLFKDIERNLLNFDDMSVTTFRYSTGVSALRIQNKYGYIILLPYQGQQIWDVVFEGRSLKMKNFFQEPAYTNKLLGSYGAFLFHCGALRMGTPGSDDDHPLHGELPGAFYDDASLIFGIDDKGSFIGMTGTYNYTKAFGDKYQAIPMVKMYKDSTILDVSITINNLASYPMDLMYMCHVNFLPAANGEIIQAAEWNTVDMLTRSSIPSHVKPTAKYLAFLNDLKNNPGATRILHPEDEYNPEIVFYIRNLKGDKNGISHIIQKHSNGSSDYISYNIKSLDHTVRWILKHDDQKVLGMALPSTCDPEGYTAEKKKGNVRSIQAGEKVTFSITTGYLSRNATTEMEKRIESIK